MSTAAPDHVEAHDSLECQQCGGAIAFVPGYDCTECRNCGHKSALAQPPGAVPAHDFIDRLDDLAEAPESIELMATHCDSCGADVEQLDELSDHHCPFCGSNIGLAATWTRDIKPHGIVPFKVSRQRAINKFEHWLQEQWFAPEALRRHGKCEQLQGIYLPFWSFDAGASCPFEGERGDHYYVTKGSDHKRRHTAWHPVRGMFFSQYDDVRVLACNSLPEELTSQVGPWSGAAVPFAPVYLAGLRCQSYQVDVKNGFLRASGEMQQRAKESVAARIGGDQQRIHSLQPHYSDVHFRLLLIPVWIGSYRHQSRSYRFLINGVTGKLHGTFPESWIKNALVAFGLIAALLFAIWLVLKLIF